MKPVLLLITLLLAGCNGWRDQWVVDTRTSAVLAAQTRRSQLIVEIEQLERLLKRTRDIAMRAVIQSQINRARFEIEQLNAIIER